MKRTLIALGVIAAVAAPLANAAPKVYGKLNLTVENYEDDAVAGKKADTSRLVSNASRFGVKGEDELTANISAIYQIEWEVNSDDADTALTTSGTKETGNSFDLTARNRYLGLKHASYGAIKLGQFDSALKLAQGEADLFNDYFGDIKTVQAGENRLKNLVEYASPKFEGLQALVQFQTNDGEKDAAGTGKAQDKAGKSFSVTYSNEDLGLYAALAADRDVNSKGAVFGTEAQRDTERAAVTYKIEDLFLTALYTRSEVADATTDATKQAETGYSIGASYALGDQVIKAQYGKGSATDFDDEVTVWSVGVDHNFTSKTKALAFYTKLDAENDAGTKTKDQSVIAVGLEHKF